MNQTVTKLAIAVAATFGLTASMVIAGEDLDRVKSQGVLKIATSANWAPQSFMNDNNKMDGFDVDVGKEIAKRLGVGYEVVTPTWDVITAGNWNGRWDISVGSMTPTSARAEVLDFPAVYYYTPAVLAVHQDSAAQSVSDLNEKVLGACTNCTFEQYLQQDLTIDAEGVPAFDYQIDPAEIRSYAETSAVLDDLRLGDGVRLDGLVDSLPAIRGAIEANYPLRIVGEPVFYEPLAVALDKGDAEFVDAVAQAVAEMKVDGTLTALSEKWYGVDYTSTR